MNSSSDWTNSISRNKRGLKKEEEKNSDPGKKKFDLLVGFGLCEDSAWVELCSEWRAKPAGLCGEA